MQILKILSKISSLIQKK